jgi:hypothetical protein
MFFSKHGKTLGPTGSGFLIENVDWFFWDDITTPGLLSRDKFWELQRTALSESDFKALNMADALAGIISGGKIDETAIKTRDAFYKKASDFLANLCEKDKHAADYWLETDWVVEDAPFGFEPRNVLKAHINILKHWGYDVDWYDAKDARGDQDVLIIMQRSRVMERIMADQAYTFHRDRAKKEFWEHYTIHTAEIIRVSGRPNRFCFELKGSTWEFDTLRDEEFLVNRRTNTETL